MNEFKVIDIPYVNGRAYFAKAAAKLKELGIGKAIEITAKNPGFHGSFKRQGVKVSSRKIGDNTYAVWIKEE